MRPRDKRGQQLGMERGQGSATRAGSCGNCGSIPEEEVAFNHCSRCKVVVYCSRACQVQHWKNGHKDTCQAASEREDTVMKAANKTVQNDEDKGPSKPSGKKKKKPKPSSSSSGGAAAAEE